MVPKHLLPIGTENPKSIITIYAYYVGVRLSKILTEVNIFLLKLSEIYNILGLTSIF